MGGLGSRFSSVGFSTPKPFLPLFGKTMIEVVIENLSTNKTKKVVLVVRSHHEALIEELRPRIQGQLAKQGSGHLSIVYLDSISEGPAHSVFLSIDELEYDLPLIVANSDQYVMGGIEDLYDELAKMPRRNSLLLLQDSDPKWSFARLDDNSLVMEVREKEPISRHATAGIYGFATVAEFKEAFIRMRESGDRTNGELYVGPAYNYVTSPTHGIHLGLNQERFFGLGTPDDYNFFLRKFRDSAS